MSESKQLEIDPEDVIECQCFLVFCINQNGTFFPDRVYKSIELAKKRVEYMNKISGGRATWQICYSELGN